MTQELKPGEFVVNEDGSVTYCGHISGRMVCVTRASQISDSYATTSDYIAACLSAGYKLHEYAIQFPSGRRYSTEGSAIKEVAPASTEKQRAPLPNSDAWRYTGKTFDRFAGFEVKSARAVDDPSYTMDEHASPLQRLNESTSHQLAKQGSAFLIED